MSDAADIIRHNAMNVLRAEMFAHGAHAAIGQMRKYTGEPYMTHPIEVSLIVKTVPHDQNMVAAALLHDVVEDTQVTIELILGLFGEDIGALVAAVTDAPVVEGGPNRAVRKALDRARLHAASGRAQTIKVADLIHNTSSIMEFDPKFGVTYLREKAETLAVLTKADPTLVAIARKQIEQYAAKPAAESLYDSSSAADMTNALMIKRRTSNDN